MHNSELSELFDSSSTIKFVDEDDSSSRSRRGKRDADLDRVNQQIEIYKLKISKEKNRIQTLNEQLIRQSMSSSVRRGGGDSKSNKDRETKIDTEKQLLCDRLNNKLVALNKKISENKQLRKKIDEMRQQRCRFDEIYTKLEREVRSQAEQMTRVLEEGKQTLQQRDKAASELSALAKQLGEVSKCLKLEQEELKKLQKLEFAEKEQVKSAVQRRMSRPQTTKTVLEENPKEMEEFDDEKVLDDALAKVFELTGIDNVDTLIERITATEETNFSLFSRIAELEAEASQNDAKISDAEQELARVQRSGVNNGTKRQKELHDMKEKRLNLATKIRHVEAQLEAQVNLWNGLKSKILTVHNELGLSVQDLDGTNTGVTKNNVMVYLAAMEKKTTEIMVAAQGDNDEESSSGPPASIANKTESLRKMPELPSATVGEYPELDDEDDRPLTMKELQESLRGMK